MLSQKIFILLFIAINLCSCRTYPYARAISHLYLSMNTLPGDVYKVFDDFSNSRGFEKFDELQHPFFRDRASENVKKTHPIDYSRGYRLRMLIADYSHEGYIQLNVYEDSPTGFTNKGISLFNEVNQFISQTFPNNKLVIIKEAKVTEIKNET